MKAIQIAILAALVVTGALLYKVWRGQQAEQPAPGAVTQTPAPAALPEPPESPSREAAAAPAPAPHKPSPVPSSQPLKKEPSRSAQAAAPAQAHTATTTPPTPASPPAQGREETAAAPRAPAPPPARTVTIPAGTLISARLSETLESDKMHPGDSFLAVLDSPLVVDGLVIAEKGARVEGRVVEVEQAGRVKGRAALGIQLVRFETSDGQRVAIQTETFRKEAEATKREDAAKVGLGAGLGAAIGAIAGGGKGAAIGAAAGGAAGTGAVLATRGKPAVIPVETRIDFRLSNSVTITEKR
jgi:hypothetical protein